MPSRVEEAQKAYAKKDTRLMQKAHTKEAIEKQLHKEEHNKSKGKYLGEFVYGAIDGTVTTFAVVSGATGAALAPFIIIILGFANLIADGFSMAAGNFLSEKANRDYINKERKREEFGSNERAKRKFELEKYAREGRGKVIRVNFGEKNESN